MRNVNYTELKENINNMINLLEYDSMRSAGKAKINADTLVNLYTLKNLYSQADKPEVVEVSSTIEELIKKPVGRPAKANITK